MTTQKVIQRFSESSKVIKNKIKQRGVTSASLGPLFSIAGIILKTRSLLDAGIEDNISEIFLPHVILSFIPPLIANSIYKRYSIAPRDIIIYLIGLFMSLFVQKSTFIMYIVDEIPYISKFFSLLKIKNSKEDTFTMMSWIITSELSGMFLNRLVLKKKMKVTSKDMFSMLITYSGILFLRHFKLNDYHVIVLAFIIPFSVKAIEHLRKPAKVKVTEKEEVPKRPKRKASISAQNKNK